MQTNGISTHFSLIFNVELSTSSISEALNASSTSSSLTSVSSPKSDCDFDEAEIDDRKH